MKSVHVMVGALLAVAAAGATVPAAVAAQPKGLSNVEKAAEALQISNIMGRYAALVIANHWADIGELFALDDPDVHQNVPALMSGPAVRKYFTERQAEKLKDGVMHQHTFLSPIIEVAGDGKTAKGVWDSPGIDTGGGDSAANWAWVRYAVDFKKIDGTWKIWHLSVLPVWRVAYGEEWAKMVAKDSGGKASGGGEAAGGAPAGGAGGGAAGGRGAGGPPGAGGGGPPGGGGAPGGGAANAAAGGGATAGMKSVSKWRYNGVGDTPLLPAVLPTPYYTFDPKDAY
ncbi:MAG: nuclear transport factor 2 family protein [Steroidobacteraceae bacterium]